MAPMPESKHGRPANRPAVLLYQTGFFYCSGRLTADSALMKPQPSSPEYPAPMRFTMKPVNVELSLMTPLTRMPLLVGVPSGINTPPPNKSPWELITPPALPLAGPPNGAPPVGEP